MNIYIYIHNFGTPQTRFVWFHFQKLPNFTSLPRGAAKPALLHREVVRSSRQIIILCIITIIIIICSATSPIWSWCVRFFCVWIVCINLCRRCIQTSKVYYYKKYDSRNWSLESWSRDADDVWRFFMYCMLPSGLCWVIDDGEMSSELFD